MQKYVERNLKHPECSHSQTKNAYRSVYFDLFLFCLIILLVLHNCNHISHVIYVFHNFILPELNSLYFFVLDLFIFTYVFAFSPSL